MTKRSTSKCVECGKTANLESGPEDIMVGSFGTDALIDLLWSVGSAYGVKKEKAS